MKEIRVLLLNGSPRANGNTALALREMEKVFAQNGVQTETVLLGNQAIRGCMSDRARPVGLRPEPFCPHHTVYSHSRNHRSG